jgi:hypothetical protein
MMNPGTTTADDRIRGALRDALLRDLRRSRRLRRRTFILTLVIAVVYDLVGAAGLWLVTHTLSGPWHVPPLGYWTCLWVTLGASAFLLAIRPHTSTHTRTE